VEDWAEIRRLYRAEEMPIKEIHVYLRTNTGAADSADLRVTYVRERFASILDFGDLDIPEGAMDPFIGNIAEKLARSVLPGR
jgi:hypothetical protein